MTRFLLLFTFTLYYSFFAQTQNKKPQPLGHGVNATQVSHLDEKSVIKFSVEPSLTSAIINIDINYKLGGIANITLTATNGNVMMDESVEVVKGKNQIKLHNKNLGKGIYILHVSSGTMAASQRIQVLKQT